MKQPRVSCMSWMIMVFTNTWNTQESQGIWRGILLHEWLRNISFRGPYVSLEISGTILKFNRLKCKWVNELHREWLEIIVVKIDFDCKDNRAWVETWHAKRK